MDTPQKPSMGRIVIYNHPGSADGKYAPMQSPAIVQSVYEDGTTVDLCIFSNGNGIGFTKSIPMKQEGVTAPNATSWEWPTRV